MAFDVQRSWTVIHLINASDFFSDLLITGHTTAHFLKTYNTIVYGHAVNQFIVHLAEDIRQQCQ
jgi:hypothetical protein